MIDGSEKRNRQLAFELQNSHVCEKRSNVRSLRKLVSFVFPRVLMFPSTSSLENKCFPRDLT